MQREGCGIVDTLDLVYFLRQKELISEGEQRQIVHQMRGAEVRFLSLDVEEITYWTTRAAVSSGRLTDSRELQTLRRSYARSLLDCDGLNIVSPILAHQSSGPSSSLQVPGLSMQLSKSGPLPVRTLSRKLVRMGTSQPLPARPRAVFYECRTLRPSDLQLEAAVLAGFLVASFSVWSSNDNDRQPPRLP